MSVNLTIRSGTTRAYPEGGDRDYAAQATLWAQDVTNAVNDSTVLGTGYAVDYVVGSAANVTAGLADYSTIEDAITAAADGNIIKILAGAYSQAAILDITKKLTIIGHGSGTIIDSAAGIAAGAIVKISTTDVTLKDLVIDDGSGTPDYALEIAAGSSRVNVDIKVDGVYATSTVLNSSDAVEITTDGTVTVSGTGDAAVLLKDNSATALKIGSAGATGIITVDTTNGSEKVIISGDLDVSGAIDLDSVALNDTDDSHDLSLIWNEDDLADRVLNLKVQGGDRTLDLAENLTLNDGFNLDVTVEDADASIILDNVHFEVENTAATQRTIKVKAGTDADATITVEGANSVVNQDLTTDAAVTFAAVTTTGNVIVGGDFTVNGTTVTIDTDNLVVEDKNITVNSGGTDITSEGAGITVERTGADGSIIYADAAASKFKIGAVGAEVEVVDLSTAQTITGKTISGNTAANLSPDGVETLTLPVATDTLVGKATTDILENKTLDSSTVGGAANDGTDGFVLFKDQSADPAATVGDDVKVFAKDKGLYKVDSTGVATEIGSGTGSGELNYISNPSAAIDETGWDASTAGEVDVSRTTTASELPRENLTATGIKIVGTGTVDATNDYVVFGSDPLNPWILDDADLGKLLKITWDQKPLGTYAAGDYECVVYDVDNAVEIECSVSAIPAYTGQFYTTFMTDSTSTNYQLWIRSTVAATDGIVISDVVVGPGLRVMSPDPRWPSYDETEVDITGATATTANFQPYQDSGGKWRMRFNFHVTGITGTGAALTITVSGFQASPTLQAVTFYDPLTQTRSADQFSQAWTQLPGGNVTRIRADWSGTVGLPPDAYFSGDISIADKPAFATKPSPDMYLAGMPDTEVLGSDWTAYTPTNTQGFGTIASVNLEWRRNGADLELRGYFTSGTVAASEAQIELPNSYVIGGSGASLVHAGTLIEDRSASTFANVLATKGDTYLNFSSVSLGSSGSTSLTPANGSAIVASSTRMSIRAKVPIQGWTTREYLANAIVGFNEATADRPGLVQKNRWQIKKLAADVEADVTDISSLGGVYSDFRFDNLVVGKTYKITLSGYIALIGTSASEFAAFSAEHDSSLLLRQWVRADAISDEHSFTNDASRIFVATSTSLTFNFAESNSARLNGADALSETTVTLEELANYKVTTEW
jgi:hypothetical protein